MMTELRGNKAIEDAAIAWVMERERAAGREPRDTRYRGAPADIESPPRLIEGPGEPGAYTERTYIKICSTSLPVLEGWASKVVGGVLDPGCACN